MNMLLKWIPVKNTNMFEQRLTIKNVPRMFPLFHTPVWTPQPKLQSTLLWVTAMVVQPMPYSLLTGFQNAIRFWSEVFFKMLLTFQNFSKLSRDFPHNITSKSSLLSSKAFIQTTILISFFNYLSLPIQGIYTHLCAVHQTHQTSSPMKLGTRCSHCTESLYNPTHIFHDLFSQASAQMEPCQVHLFNSTCSLTVRTLRAMPCLAFLCLHSINEHLI